MNTPSISIDRINEIIEEEMKYAREANVPLMVMGMSQIQLLLNKEAEEIKYGKRD